MAFFGLTALGPQDQFRAARDDAYTCELFDLSEFAQAFDAVLGGRAAAASARLAPERVDEVLRRVFHGEVPAPERAKVAAHFAGLGLGPDAEPMSREAFLGAIEQLRALEAKTPLDTSVSAHYTSSELLREHRLRQIRPEVGPEGIYAKPLTALTEIGWRGFEQPVGYVRYPKKACEETKFLGEMAKAGLI